MPKINGHIYEPEQDLYEQVLQAFEEGAFPVSAECDSERHRACVGENAEDCWCACHEVDQGGRD